MKKRKFAVFITSHRRPNNLLSLETLRRVGYTGKVYIVLDNTDDTVEMYRQNYSDEILIFDKLELVTQLDIGMSHSNPKLAAVLYAREAVERFAKTLKLTHFMVMDDDVWNIRYRYPDGKSCRSLQMKDFDKVLEAYLEFLDDTSATCISFANNFLFVNGRHAVFDKGKSFERRSCHNIFIRRTDRELIWSFAMNEDYISALRGASIGKLWLVPPFVEEQLLDMNNFTENFGGMFNFYQSTTSFERAFYATVACPWCCKPELYGDKFIIGVKKQYAYPKILGQKEKKYGKTI